MATPQGVILSILQGYQASEDFRGLADSTRRSYLPLIVRIEKAFGDFPLTALTDRRTRGVFMNWRDQLATASGRRQADYAWSVLARVLSWALNRGLIAVNPCTHGGDSIVARDAKAFGRQLTKPRSWNGRRRICTCRCCWRYGPGNGKAISCGCRGRPMTARPSVCAKARPARGS